ncbi:MAG: helix-turn-helix transcriptional regulator [Flavobacteriaceae bacterium CG_4_8_14_3_um_filter_34_10]|nr:MAG: hypothetical protein AUK33_02895 [Flavobacteriaceae bacterium CG2_30_34_30]PIQ17678.1 MAG: helix-turn-helix transcriptional regulator [Flavobacteriaceae bacterium CG18_big_fil_WC_8_21_14_2_50_34_36]PIV51387.1 MAG: helix-turn-helix transcriptional regulator [Flavobacteriaceae bacterium CG02_land_8_20_14_3_00_34_13]PIX09270.1 MAG: helix-turn-helix transcriptional regulator [Flavobacteriaceae bacterium CG_4_8_14_3_um_filter_34_10]PIZ08386.1 MAG: helix-turn-helix transcriptional regulator [
MHKTLILFTILLISFCGSAQYSFSGYVNLEEWQDHVYLSVVDDYRKISAVYEEQILCEIKADSTGYFAFTGNDLVNENKIYRIHVSKCKSDIQKENPYDVSCKNIKQVVFIAKNKDSIFFPLSFDNQVFCKIETNNPKALTIMRVDSLKEEMKFVYSEFTNEENRKENSEKWFKTLQDIGSKSQEPLVEIYIYAFLSDRANNFHTYYLQDLKTSSYYKELQKRLEDTYPNSTYTKQYQGELLGDTFTQTGKIESKTTFWEYLMYFLILVSLIGNLVFWVFIKKKTPEETE